MGFCFHQENKLSYDKGQGPNRLIGKRLLIIQSHSTKGLKAAFQMLLHTNQEVSGRVSRLVGFKKILKLLIGQA